MTSIQDAGPDAARSRLRATIATMEQQLAHLPAPAAGADGKVPANELLASFNDLVQQLALGPEPELRVCPVCKSVGMREATICGHCWTKLTPPARGAAVGS